MNDETLDEIKDKLIELNTKAENTSKR